VTSMTQTISTSVVGLASLNLHDVSIFIGGKTTSSRAVVQSAGAALELPATELLSEFDRGSPVLHLLLRHTQTLLTQIALPSVCNRHHSLHQ